MNDKKIGTVHKDELIYMTQTLTGGSQEYNYAKNLLSITEMDPDTPVVCRGVR